MASVTDLRDLNTSIVSDLSTLNDGDFNMIVEHLLCKPKKMKRPKKSYHRKVQAAHSVPALNAVMDFFSAHDEPDECAVNATFSAATNTSCLSFNDTCATINSEQLENIFAYFDQDVTTDDLLLSDESDDDEPNTVQPLIERENLASNLQNLLLNDKSKSKKKQPSQQRQDTKDIQNKSKAILNKIQQFNGEADAMKSNVVGRVPSSHSQNRPVSVISTSSTASLHDSDSDTVFKKPNNFVKNGNVRSKVAFFSDHSSSDRSSSASPSIQSTSDEDEFQFQRTKSKRDFKRNRDFFENFFKVKKHDQSAIDSTTIQTEHKSTNHSKNNDDENFRKQASINDQMDAHEKLRAVQTYVQTQYLLERIQRLVTAISNLDEKRLSSMNLKMLKKFLTFIRDCSYNCTEVCNSIGHNILTDFEKNVMSAEELLYSALKEAHSTQVPNSSPNSILLTSCVFLA